MIPSIWSQSSCVGVAAVLTAEKTALVETLAVTLHFLGVVHRPMARCTLVASTPVWHCVFFERRDEKIKWEAESAALHLVRYFVVDALLKGTLTVVFSRRGACWSIMFFVYTFSWIIQWVPVIYKGTQLLDPHCNNCICLRVTVSLDLWLEYCWLNWEPQLQAKTKK